MLSEMKQIPDHGFAQFMVDQTPRFDELIIQSIRPRDGWLLCGSSVPAWWETREEVRKMAEGLAYHQSRKVFESPIQGRPVEITKDRFKDVWPAP